MILGKPNQIGSAAVHTLENRLTPKLTEYNHLNITLFISRSNSAISSLTILW